MHRTMQGTLHPVFRSRQLLLASTAKPVTPFGGLVSVIEFFNALKLGEVLGRLMPFADTSPNAILPEQTLLAFVISIIAGARRLAHTDWLRADRALHAMLGIARFTGTDTVRNLLKRFTQPMIEAFWRPLWRWLLQQGWTVPTEGWSLDMDGTVFQRSGHQEGGGAWLQPGAAHASPAARRAGGGRAGVAWLVAQWQGGLGAWRGAVFTQGLDAARMSTAAQRASWRPGRACL